MVTTGIGFSAPDVDCARPLRIAVVLDRGAVSAWVQELLSSLERRPLGRPPRRRRRRSRVAHLAAVRRVPVPAHGSAGPPPDRTPVARRRAAPRRGRFRRGRRPPSSAPIASTWSSMSGRGRRVRCRSSTPAGRNVWSIEFGTPQDRPSGPSLFWAWFDQHPVAEVNVVQEEAATGRRTLVASSTVSMHDRSLTVSRSRAYWRAGDLILRELAPSRHLGAAPACQRGHARASNRSSSRSRCRVLAVVLSHRRSSVSAVLLDTCWECPRRREQWILGVRRARGRPSPRRAQRLRGDHPASRPGVRRPLRRVRRCAPVPLHRGIHLRERQGPHLGDRARSRRLGVRSATRPGAPVSPVVSVRVQRRCRLVPDPRDRIETRPSSSTGRWPSPTHGSSSPSWSAASRAFDTTLHVDEQRSLLALHEPRAAWTEPQRRAASSSRATTSPGRGLRTRRTRSCPTFGSPDRREDSSSRTTASSVRPRTARVVTAPRSCSVAS